MGQPFRTIPQKLFRQARTNDLFVVPHEDALAGVRRMAPAHSSPERFVGWLQDVSPADLFVLIGRETSDDQVARFAEQEIAIAVPGQKRGAVRFAPLPAGRGLERF